MKKAAVFFLLAIEVTVFSQNFFTQTGKVILLDNGFVKRKITIENGKLLTSDFMLNTDSSSIISPSRDFSFSINNKRYDGQSGWKLTATKPIEQADGGRGVSLILSPAGDFPGFSIAISYLLYPGFPIIRKWISFNNIGPSDIKIESVNVEDLNTNLNFISSVVYHNYARMKHLGTFVGNHDDPVVVVHDITQRKGMALGNEAIGVLKRTAFHTRLNNIEIGLTHPGQSFPFRKYLKPGEYWLSPASFICLYSKKNDGFEVIDETFPIGQGVIRRPGPEFVLIVSFADEHIIADPIEAPVFFRAGAQGQDDGNDE